MSRPTKATVDYFPMDCTPDDRLSAIENLYGNAGFIVWVKLNQKLGRSENHIIDIRSGIERKIFFSLFKVEEDVVMEILDTLAELNCIDKTLWENKLIYSGEFVERITDAYRKRNVKPLEYDEILEFYNISSGINEVSGAGNPQTKQKKTKPKETKAKETKAKETKTKETKEKHTQKKEKTEKSENSETEISCVCDNKTSLSGKDSGVCTETTADNDTSKCAGKSPISDEDMEILRKYASRTAKNVDAYVNTLISNGSYISIIERQKRCKKSQAGSQYAIYRPQEPFTVTEEEDAKIRETMRKIKEQLAAKGIHRASDKQAG